MTTTSGIDTLRGGVAGSIIRDVKQPYKRYGLHDAANEVKPRSTITMEV